MLYMMQHSAVSLGVGSGLSGLQAYVSREETMTTKNHSWSTS